MGGGPHRVARPSDTNRAFQRTFGRSTKVRGAGLFVSTLARKLEAAGGQLIEFGTRNTCLSQFDHVDGTLTKKPRSQRYHEFSDGMRVGRNLYSASLARFVHNDRLDASQVRAAWPGAEALLRAASDGFEPASGRGFALPHVTLGVGAGRSRNPGQRVREAGEVYPQALVSAARASESGAILEPQMAHDQEAPGFQPGEASPKQDSIVVVVGWQLDRLLEFEACGHRGRRHVCWFHPHLGRRPTRLSEDRRRFARLSMPVDDNE